MQLTKEEGAKMLRRKRLEALARRIDRLTVASTSTASFGPYLDDPFAFRKDVLGFESATHRSTGEPYQDNILRAVPEAARVVIQAGHGVGKTRTLATLALWWLLTRPYSRVVIVAPTFGRQVRGVIFAEMPPWFGKPGLSYLSRSGRVGSSSVATEIPGPLSAFLRPHLTG